MRKAIETMKAMMRQIIDTQLVTKMMNEFETKYKSNADQN